MSMSVLSVSVVAIVVVALLLLLVELSALIERSIEHSLLKYLRYGAGIVAVVAQAWSIYGLYMAYI